MDGQCCLPSSLKGAVDGADFFAGCLMIIDLKLFSELAMLEFLKVLCSALGSCETVAVKPFQPEC